MTDQPVDQDDDFGALFEESLKAKRRRFSIGERVKATVVQVGRERLILDLGDGQDALMEVKELGPAEDRPELREGDVIEAYVVRFENRVAELGLKSARAGGHGAAQLEEAHRTGLPVQGRIAEVNKGGYVVEVGGTRCFCPLGAMDVRRIEDPTVMIGQAPLFRVIEAKEGRDFVLSRRVLLEEENARRAAETRGRLSVGARLRGTVTNVREFGAFVDLGGVEGLVPASELGWGRVRVEDVVRAGQQVDVQVLAMEPGKDGRERLTLSMKALLDDPFGAISQQLQPGTIVAGTVTRLQPFGAFVELVPGVEGLVHVSAFGKRVAHPSDAVKAGQRVAVRVDGVDPEARRVSLHLADQAELQGRDVSSSGLCVLRHAEPAAPAASEPSPAGALPAAALPKVGDVFDATVDRVEKFGVFVSFPGGRGLVPARELGIPRGTDLRRQFQTGAAMKVTIIDVRDDGKLTLSKTAVERAEERADTEAWMQRSRPDSGRGFSTLGDLLKDKLGR